MKELDRTKDSRIIRQLDRISSIYSGGQRVEIPQGRGQIIFSVAGDTTVVTAEMMNKTVEGRTYLDTEIGISLEELTASESSTNSIRLTESCASYLNAIYEATSEGHADQSREVGYNYCLIVPDRSRDGANNAMIVENTNGHLDSYPIPAQSIDKTIYAVALQRAKFDFANNYAENPIHCLGECDLSLEG